MKTNLKAVELYPNHDGSVDLVLRDKDGLLSWLCTIPKVGYTETAAIDAATKIADFADTHVNDYTHEFVEVRA